MTTDPVWDYSSKYGQHTWGQHWKIGNHQSPINILTKDTQYDATLHENPLVFKSTGTKLSALNKGINISIKPESVGENFMHKGPHGDEKYEFIECHFHWGRNFQKGSEHEINGEKDEAELHLVHKNSTIDDPLGHGNGLSVLGIMLKIADDANTHPTLKAILQMLSHVPHKDDQYTRDEPVSIYDLVDGISKKYYTYNGSLTTPPVAECVRWIVFKEALVISRADYEVFNRLYPVHKESSDSTSAHDPYARSEETRIANPLIGDNFRDTCCVNGRLIRSSFE